MGMPKVGYIHVQCKQCGNWEVIGEGVDPHGALKCGCCPLDHHHGEAANACPGSSDTAGPTGHDGVPCGPDIDGCTVCRPIIITGLAGMAPMAITVAQEG